MVYICCVQSMKRWLNQRSSLKADFYSILIGFISLLPFVPLLARWELGKIQTNATARTARMEGGGKRKEEKKEKKKRRQAYPPCRWNKLEMGVSSRSFGVERSFVYFIFVTYLAEPAVVTKLRRSLLTQFWFFLRASLMAFHSPYLFFFFYLIKRTEANRQQRKRSIA